MTREEQIIAEAKKYYSKDINCYDAFLHGVEFAESLFSCTNVGMVCRKIEIMTREQEIKQAIKNNLDISNYSPQDGEMLKETFYIGAKWADEHPKSPWISVEEDLPFNHKELLYDTESSIFPSTKLVLIRTEKDAHELSFMYIYGYRWNWDYELDKITHWMPIPEI